MRDENNCLNGATGADNSDKIEIIDESNTEPIKDETQEKKCLAVSDKEKENSKKNTSSTLNESAGSANLHNGSVGENEEESPINTKQKINAFQYMMSNRHKSIGTNSPGKEMDINNVENNIDKKVLQARRDLLENWAEVKGASKRKREYDEQQMFINQKLEERAKKLKQMLKIDSQSDDEVIVNRKRRCVKIESDEDSQDNEKSMSEKPKRKLKRGKATKLSLNHKIDSEDIINCDVLENTEKITRRSLTHWKIKLSQKLEKTDESENNQPENRNSESLENADKRLENELKAENGHEKMVLRTRKSKLNLLDEEVLDLSDDEWIPRDNKKKRTVKVAPVFLKAAPRPKLDPEVAEARRQFLLSGIPESLKKEKEKQQIAEELEFDVFPAISHVQQKTAHEFWNLPKSIDIGYVINDDEPVHFVTESFSLKTTKTETSENQHDQESLNLNKIKNYKNIINVIKTQNPNYPVYRVFKSLYKRSGYNKVVETKQKTPPKRRGRKKKGSLNKTIEVVNENQLQIEDAAMWTEKYKPRSSEDILGNRKSANSLKDWLTNWLNIINEKKIKKRTYGSESEFDITDSDSRDSTKSYSNTIILKGPHGSGKTSTVYAVCNELGLSVLEVNASSRRTGKWLLQELQEATQSHQVRKKENILSFVKEQKTKKSTKQKMCVLLIEDIDLVFEQDEGFIAALMQIMATSKRPIILTTTGETAANLQKILANHKSITFLPFSSVLSVWLQIVCLIEGCYVNVGSLEMLLNYNRGDIRRTLLHLQYWVASGGEVNENGAINDKVEIDELMMEDDNSNMSDLKLEESTDGNASIHSLDISCFESVEKYELFSLPHENNLEVVWWNLSRLLDLPDFSNFRRNRDDNGCFESSQVDKERHKLNSLSKFYDSLAFVDTISDRNYFYESLERPWSSKPINSIALGENVNNYSDNFNNELINTLLGANIKHYKEKSGGTYTEMNMAVPTIDEQRWHRKQIGCEEELKEALLISDCLERKSVALDYMPALRSIVRSENRQAANGIKRRNRLYNYSRSLGIYGGESLYKTACNVFKTKILSEVS